MSQGLMIASAPLTQEQAGVLLDIVQRVSFPGAQAADALALMLALKRIAEGQDLVTSKEVS